MKKLILSTQTRTLKLLRNTVRHKISSISCIFTKRYLILVSRLQGHLTVGHFNRWKYIMKRVFRIFNLLIFAVLWCVLCFINQEHNMVI